MAKKRHQPKKSGKATEKGKRTTLNRVIDEDQREYIEGVREWLRDSLQNKGKIVGGPI